MAGSPDVASSSDSTTPVSRWTSGRIILGFWLLGMCNNYIYVIMLSAAHDVISKVEKENVFNETNITTTETPITARNCNELSTGAILLADILPTLFVKLICPFLPFFVHTRIGFAVVTGVIALILVGLANSIGIALLGVCFASFNSGLGEITLLAYSTLFPLIAVAAWSSGTGGAGLIGSFAYAGMTEGGLTPEMTLFVSISIPLLMAISFWFILKHPTRSKPSHSNKSNEPISGIQAENTSENNSPEANAHDQEAESGEHTSNAVQPNEPISRRKSIVSKLVSDITYVPKLLPFMIPVGLVYFFEYLINSGLFELLGFENSSLDEKSQFRWYQVMYQAGVFISRSSVTWIHIEKVWILAVLQAANLAIVSADAVYGFIPNVWIMFALIFWEGLLGGAAYVNTFYNMSYKIPEEKRLFALSVASVADTFGIVGAGLASFPVHDAICKLPLEPIFRWP